MQNEKSVDDVLSEIQDLFVDNDTSSTPEHATNGTEIITDKFFYKNRTAILFIGIFIAITVFF